VSGNRSGGTDKKGNTMNGIQQSVAQYGLIRPVEGRVLGGVCAGLGRRFGISAWAARLLFLVLLMVVPGSQILIYPVLWILMPSEESVLAPTTVPPAPTG
jgi:phage shock protein C